MTANEFINEIETAWDRELSGKQSLIYKRKLERFGDWQLDDLLEKVLENCKYFPKLADIWGVAQQIGLFKDAERRSRTTSIHTWKPTGCQLCGGDGRLTVFMAVLFEHDETGQRHQQLQLRRIFRASDYSSISAYKPEREERDFLFRCSCPAGDAETLPAAWPKWKGSAGGYQAAGRETREPVRGDELKVQSIAETAKRQQPRTGWDEEEVSF